MNQRKLSEISGVKPPTLNKAIKGHRNLNNENMRKIADALGVSVEYFSGGPLDAVLEPGARRVPIISSVPMGDPRTAEADHGWNEWAYVSGISDGCYALRGKGDCMSPTIEDGDLVICKFAEEVPFGKVAVCRNEWGEFTLKRIKRRDNGEIALFCDNEDQAKFPPLPSNGWRVVGIALKSINEKEL